MGAYDCNHSTFLRLLERLIGETVRIQTDDSSYRGRLAEVEPGFVTLATRNSVNESAIRLVFIPVRHIQALTER